MDEQTYQAVSDSIPFFKESRIDAGDETWSGKYSYFELFKPGSYKGAKQGQFGMAFMPDKAGTLEIIAARWKETKDSIDLENREYVVEGVCYPVVHFAFTSG